MALYSNTGSWSSYCQIEKDTFEMLKIPLTYITKYIKNGVMGKRILLALNMSKSYLKPNKQDFLSVSVPLGFA